MAEWKFPVFGHGGDYNPDQWLHDEHVLEEDVRLMKSHVCEGINVKAAGGIRSLADALAMIEAGATRLGTSAGVKIMQELDAQ